MDSDCPLLHAQSSLISVDVEASGAGTPCFIAAQQLIPATSLGRPFHLFSEFCRKSWNIPESQVDFSTPATLAYTRRTRSELRRFDMVNATLKAVTRTLLGLLTAVAVAMPVIAGNPQKMTNTGSDNVAIKGYDTVAYFTEGQPMKGKPEFAYSWNDGRWPLARLRTSIRRSGRSSMGSFT
jgi:hypothetical protein